MKATDNNYQDYLTEMQLVWGKGKSMIDYCIKEAHQVIKLTDGRITGFRQPSIEHEFCFGYSSCGQGQTFDEAMNEERDVHKNMEKYFLDYNMSHARYNEEIASLKDKDNHLYLAVKYNNGKNLVRYAATDEWGIQRCLFGNEFALSQHQDEDKALIVAALEKEKAYFEKRLRSWWKRYGASKCRTWTYWLDD